MMKTRSVQLMSVMLATVLHTAQGVIKVNERFIVEKPGHPLNGQNGTLKDIIEKKDGGIIYYVHIDGANEKHTNMLYDNKTSTSPILTPLQPHRPIPTSFMTKEPVKLKGFPQMMNINGTVCMVKGPVKITNKKLQGGLDYTGKFIVKPKSGSLTPWGKWNDAPVQCIDDPTCFIVDPKNLETIKIPYPTQFIRYQPVELAGFSDNHINSRPGKIVKPEKIPNSQFYTGRYMVKMGSRLDWTNTKLSERPEQMKNDPTCILVYPENLKTALKQTGRSFIGSNRRGRGGRNIAKRFTAIRRRLLNRLSFRGRRLIARDRRLRRSS